MQKKFFLLLCFICWGVFSRAQVSSSSKEILPPYLYVHANWVDSLLNSMSLDEKIGQLFMIACWSNKADSEYSRVGNLIRNYNIGGLIFMQGGPVRQAQLTNYFQGISKVPLLISQDAEWGLSMRIDSTILFPKEIMLGAISDTSLIYDFGSEMARECKRVGVNLSFSPVIDVNNNPLNPIIGERSFGESKYEVARRGYAYMRGLQDHGVIACAKHFPGHGNTDQDSHKILPVVNSSREELDSFELFPFRKLIDNGVGCVMVAHLNVPALDTTRNRPSTLSPKIVTGLLRNELGFHGLVITDALNMGAIKGFSEPGTADVDALLAGNDILLFSQDVPIAVQMIKDKINGGEISETDINIHVRKILQAKYWCGLNHFQPIELQHLYGDLNTDEARYLKQQLVEHALTLPHNKDLLIPLANLTAYQFASVTIGDTITTSFQTILGNYASVKNFSILKLSSEKKFNELEDSLRDYNSIFVSLHSMSRQAASNFGVTDNSKEFIAHLQKHAKVFLTVFGSPYALHYFDDVDWVLEAFNEDEMTQKLAAQAWFGGIGVQGNLPVTSSSAFFLGQGFYTTPVREKFSMPEEAGIESSSLREIDTLAQQAISEHATPGCQVWIAKDGKVIWNKSYGNFTYDAEQQVTNHNLYDLASVTKVGATTLMVMKLYEQKKILLSKSIGDYLPEFKNSNKAGITISELLTHSGGLKPFIPFYKEALDTSKSLNPKIFSPQHGGLFTVEVTPQLFMNRNYIDTMWKRIKDSPVEAKGKYVYSDLDFYFLKRICEKIAGEPLDQFLYEDFYAPLGLSTMSFNPLRFFPKDEIVPSNFDYNFRKDLLQGSVHDQGAAMMGGIEGHAGLFSDANDLGILMQMLLNNGVYAGKRFLDSSTVKKFTSQFGKNSRRGLGFDKPGTSGASPCCKSASPETFGHQGFTGTCVWVDPKYNLIYVFLSNRTFPDDENTKLNSLSTRTKIQEVIYQAILSSDK